MSQPVSKGPRSAFVAIVGRPSAGKSTLMNALCGEKVAIVSPVPQTTRNRIRGIVNRDDGQLVFVDTPGFHESTRTFNRHMRGLIDETIRDSEVLLYVVDSSRPPGDEELSLIEMVARASIPRVVALNKVDVARPKQIEEMKLLLEQRLPDVRVLEVSALKLEGIEALVDELLQHAPAGEPVYPSDFYTDQPPEFRVSEIIREKALQGLREELPHAIYVQIEDMEVHELETGGQQLWIRAFIYVERTSQQGMIVGAKGAGIKRIRQSAQKEIASLFPYRIHLDLRVKVDPKWRRNEAVLERLVR